MSQRGQRTNFQTPRYGGKAKVDLQNQFIGIAERSLNFSHPSAGD
jgi:hypothetical protein